jgi:hypothetical protein
MFCRIRLPYEGTPNKSYTGTIILACAAVASGVYILLKQNPRKNLN